MPDDKTTRKYERKDYVHCEACGGLILRSLLRRRAAGIFDDEPERVECPVGHPIVETPAT